MTDNLPEVRKEGIVQLEEYSDTEREMITGHNPSSHVFMNKYGVAGFLDVSNAMGSSETSPVIKVPKRIVDFLGTKEDPEVVDVMIRKKLLNPVEKTTRMLAACGKHNIEGSEEVQLCYYGQYRGISLTHEWLQGELECIFQILDNFNRFLDQVQGSEEYVHDGYKALQVATKTTETEEP